VMNRKREFLPVPNVSIDGANINRIESCEVICLMISFDI
jgi:hypothetical protein